MRFKLPRWPLTSEQNIKLIVEYDGSRFFGFQRQRDRPTIQAALEDALSKFLDRKTKIKSASGRTDSGVHADHQVVNFFTKKKLDPDRLCRGLNFYLPKAIAVKNAEKVSGKFHARFSARSKTYEYRVWNHLFHS